MCPGLAKGEKQSIMSGTSGGIPSATKSLEVLSDRERYVVSQVARGVCLKAIAGDLAISLQTVSTYLGRAKRKLGLTARLDIAALFMTSQATVGLPAPRSGARLSSAETAVVDSLLDGNTTVAIAATRGTSVRTIENQLHSVYRKLLVTSRIELAWWAAASRWNQVSGAAPESRQGRGPRAALD